MYKLIIHIVIVAMAAATIIRMSVNPWKTTAYLMILLAFWDVLKNYIRQHNNK